MKRWTILGVTVFFLSVLPCSAGFAEAKTITEGSVTVQTLDYSRGQAGSRNSIVIVPSITARNGQFSLSMESVSDTSPYSNANSMKIQSSTINFAYGPSTEMFSTEFALALKGKDSAKDEKEISFSFSMEEGTIRPFFAIYQTVGINPALYAELGAAHSIDMGAGNSCEIAVKVGYFSSQLQKEDGPSAAHYKTNSDGSLSDERFSGWLDAEVSASVAFDLGDGIFLEPFATVALPLSGNAKNYFKANSPQGFADGSTSHFWGGVRVLF
ncbi:MAG: hypothetical protein K9K75_02970 [Deltaproteobacteria bacterium]|nr:hypothetical protein [Deltaproteobacteria bacterium]